MPLIYVDRITRRIAVGNREEATHPAALKAALAEFISTLIFVFAGQGSGMAFNKITHISSTTPSGLIAAAVAHAFGLFVAVAVSANISGGHVNPAVTFGACLGGHITILRGLLYWIAQLLGSVVACLLLKFVTNGMTTTAFGLSSGVNVWNGFVMEIRAVHNTAKTVKTAPNRSEPHRTAQNFSSGGRVGRVGGPAVAGRRGWRVRFFKPPIKPTRPA